MLTSLSSELKGRTHSEMVRGQRSLLFSRSGWLIWLVRWILWQILWIMCWYTGNSACGKMLYIYCLCVVLFEMWLSSSHRSSALCFWLMSLSVRRESRIWTQRCPSGKRPPSLSSRSLKWSIIRTTRWRRTFSEPQSSRDRSGSPSSTHQWCLCASV